MVKQIYVFLSLLLVASPLAAQTDSEKLDTLMAAYARQNAFNGSVLVARDGEVLLEKGYGTRDRATGDANDAQTVYQIGSVTKTFTSSLVMALAERGILSIDDCLSKYYSDYPVGDSITIRHLLTHTSGIHNYTENHDFMAHSAAHPATEAEMLALFRDVQPDFPVGTGWHYSNSGYSLLGYIIQKATGMPYEKAVRRYFFGPLGMARSGFDFAHLSSGDRAIGYAADSAGSFSVPTAVVDSSVSFAAGSIYSTVGDLYRWHCGLQQHDVITAASLREATKPYKNNYGYGWMVDSLYGRVVVQHSGGIWGFRSNFARVPADGICIVLLSNIETPALDGITRTILALLYGQSYRVPGTTEAVALSPEVLGRYCGSYWFESIGLRVDVKLENGMLVSLPTNGPPAVLVATDDSHFFLDGDEGFRIHFIQDERGWVTGMAIDNNGRKATARKNP